MATIPEHLLRRQLPADVAPQVPLPAPKRLVWTKDGAYLYLRTEEMLQ